MRGAARRRAAVQAVKRGWAGAQVFDEYQAWLGQYSKYTEMLPTRSFLAPLDEDEEIEVELAKGNAVSIKFKALSELQPSGMRCGTGQRL